MKKYRYYTALKVDGEWEGTDKRGYGEKDLAVLNAIELSKRGDGQEVAIIHKGEVKEIYFTGKLSSETEIKVIKLQGDQSLNTKLGEGK